MCNWLIFKRLKVGFVSVLVFVVFNMHHIGSKIPPLYNMDIIVTFRLSDTLFPNVPIFPVIAVLERQNTLFYTTAMSFANTK